MSYAVSFDKINQVADSFFSPKRQIDDRVKLIELLFKAFTFESYEQRKAKIKESFSHDYAEDWGYVFGIYCTETVFVDVIIEALGEKILKNGEKSSSGYKPEKGTKFTTYFISLLNNRMTDKYGADWQKAKTLEGKGEYNGSTGTVSKQTKRTDDNDTNETEIEPGEIESNFMAFEAALFIVAKFVSDIMKSGKAMKLTPYIYSKAAINYSREFDESFYYLNSLSETILEPLDKGFTNKMTTISKGFPEDFLELCDAELSPYVFDNDLAQNLSENIRNIKILKDKAVYVYCSESQSMLSYQQKKFYETIKNSIGEALRN